MTKEQQMQLLAQHVLNVLVIPSDDNHNDMERILDGAIDLGLVEYNDEDELVKKEL